MWIGFVAATHSCKYWSCQSCNVHHRKVDLSRQGKFSSYLGRKLPCKRFRSTSATNSLFERVQGVPLCCKSDATVIESSSTKHSQDILQSILTRKQEEVLALKREIQAQGDEHPVAKRLAKEGTFQESNTFYSALKKQNFTLSVIAEIKRKSPSKGHIGDIRDPAGLSRVYKEAGASAISVLTDYEGFGGTLDDLRKVYRAQQQYRETYPGPAPILRKDFIIDKVQIAEAAEAGAAAVLLIVSALGERTKELLDATYALGLEALVEVHNEEEVKVALEAGAKIIGINNRNLRSFEVNFEHAMNLRRLLPEHVVSVAESGISEPADAWTLRDEGFNAILVGESLVKASEGTKGIGNSYQTPLNAARGLIRAFLSKASRKYSSSSAAAYMGHGEGAKENFGSITI
eukprot:jgi/Galph1/3134/GphlegSOOS_G1782.1